jgi:hypothetical protein
MRTYCHGGSVNCLLAEALLRIPLLACKEYSVVIQGRTSNAHVKTNEVFSVPQFGRDRVPQDEISIVVGARHSGC